MGVCLVFGVSLQGDLSAWVWDVWGLSKPSSLEVDPNRNSLGTLAERWGFWDSVFLLVSLPCGCGFSCGGLVGADVCRPFSVLI